MLLGLCLTRKEIKFLVSDVCAVNECSSHSLTSDCYLLACRIAFIQGCYCPRDGWKILHSLCLCVCLSLCLSSHVSHKRLYMLPLAMARSSSDDNAVHYVLTFLWMMLCFHVMIQIQIQAIDELFTVTCLLACIGRWGGG